MPSYEFRVRVSAETPFLTRDDAESVVNAVVDMAGHQLPYMALPPKGVEVHVGDDVYADVYTTVEVVE